MLRSQNKLLVRSLRPTSRLYSNRGYNFDYNQPQYKSQFSQYDKLQYNYNQYQQYQQLHGGPPKMSFFKKFLYLTGAFTLLTAFAYYMWWPKHTFPSSVAKILRKGLWAESDKGENDYQLALKYYIEALEHCDEIELDNLSDEYTGIQIKIAEMYERMNRYDEAQFIYNEIATLYLSVLTAKKGSPFFGRIQNSAHLAHIIQKDLRIAIKLVEYNKSNVTLSKAVLTTHLAIASEEIKKLIKAAQETDSAKATSSPTSEPLGDISRQFLNFDNLPLNISHLKVLSPFIDELLNAMDLFQAICLSSGDLTSAINLNIKMIEYMLINKEPVYKVIRTCCNTGSLFYLGAEELELEELKQRKKATDVDSTNLKLIMDDGKLKITGASADLVQNDQIKPVVDALNKRSKYLDLAIVSYKAAITASKSINPSSSTLEPDQMAVALESVALATYGLGVTHLHLGEYESAERYLREARVKSKACDYEDLMPEIERELGKVFDEKKALAANASE